MIEKLCVHFVLSYTGVKKEQNRPTSFFYLKEEKQQCLLGPPIKAK